MTIHCSFQILFVTFYGSFVTIQGKASNLASLRRTGDISLDFDERTGAITVFGNLGLSELNVSRHQ
jgi:hypothetical protein